MALLAAVRTTRSLVPAHQDGQQNFLDSLAHSGSGPSSTPNSCFGQAGMSDALCRSASSRGWLGSQLPSRGRRSDGEEGEGSRLRRALQAGPPQALSSAAPAAVPHWPVCGPPVRSATLTVSQSSSLCRALAPVHEEESGLSEVGKRGLGQGSLLASWVLFLCLVALRAPEVGLLADGKVGRVK